VPTLVAAEDAEAVGFTDWHFELVLHLHPFRAGCGRAAAPAGAFLPATCDVGVAVSPPHFTYPHALPPPYTLRGAAKPRRTDSLRLQRGLLRWRAAPPLPLTTIAVSSPAAVSSCWIPGAAPDLLLTLFAPPFSPYLYANARVSYILRDDAAYRGRLRFRVRALAPVPRRAARFWYYALLRALGFRPPHRHSFPGLLRVCDVALVVAFHSSAYGFVGIPPRWAGGAVYTTAPAVLPPRTCLFCFL
jgi:hypothetical protein